MTPIPRPLLRCVTCSTIYRDGEHPTCDPLAVIRFRAQLLVLGAYFNKGARR